MDRHLITELRDAIFALCSGCGAKFSGGGQTISGGAESVYVQPTEGIAVCEYKGTKGWAIGPEEVVGKNCHSLLPVGIPVCNLEVDAGAPTTTSSGDYGLIELLQKHLGSGLSMLKHPLHESPFFMREWAWEAGHFSSIRCVGPWWLPLVVIHGGWMVAALSLGNVIGSGGSGKTRSSMLCSQVNAPPRSKKAMRWS